MPIVLLLLFKLRFNDVPKFEESLGPTFLAPWCSKIWTVPFFCWTEPYGLGSVEQPKFYHAIANKFRLTGLTITSHAHKSADRLVNFKLFFHTLPWLSWADTIQGAAATFTAKTRKHFLGSEDIGLLLPWSQKILTFPEGIWRLLWSNCSWTLQK